MELTIERPIIYRKLTPSGVLQLLHAISFQTALKFEIFLLLRILLNRLTRYASFDVQTGITFCSAAYRYALIKANRIRVRAIDLDSCNIGESAGITGATSHYFDFKIR